MGSVLSAGIGQAPARQAAIYAGLPPAVGAATVNKVCGSGLKAVVLRRQGDRARRRRRRRRRRHGVDDQRAPTTCPRRAPATAWATAGRRRDDPRRSVGPVQQLPHGRLRRALRQGKGVHRATRRTPTPPSRSPRPARAGRRAFRAEIVPVEVPQKKGAPSRSTRTKGPAAATSTSSRRCARRSRRTARSPPATRRRSTTAPRAGADGGGGRDGARMKPLARIVASPGTRRRPSGSPPRRPPRSKACCKRAG